MFKSEIETDSVTERRKIEIEFENAKKLLNTYKTTWENTGSSGTEYLMEKQQKYVGELAYKIQSMRMHDELVEANYILDEEKEDIVIEYASMWSEDVCKVAQAMIQGDLKKLSFEEFVEEVAVEHYRCIGGSIGLDIFREFQRWMPTDEFKEFIKDHFVKDEENIVENFDNDYVIVMNC